MSATATPIAILETIVDLQKLSESPILIAALMIQIAILTSNIAALLYFIRNYMLVQKDNPSPSLTYGRRIVIIMISATLLVEITNTLHIYAKRNDAIWGLMNWANCFQAILMAVFNLQIIALFSVLLPKRMRFVTKKTVFKYQMIFVGAGVILCLGYLMRFWAYSDDDPKMKPMVLYRSVGFILFAFPTFTWSVIQDFALIMSSYRHLISIQPDKTSHVQYVARRTRRLIIILGVCSSCVLISGLTYTLQQFVYPDSNPKTALISAQLTSLGDTSIAIYCIGSGVSFEELIFNQLNSTIGSNKTLRQTRRNAAGNRKGSGLS